jgi:hypothetical protein
MRRFVAAAIHAAGKQEAVANLLARDGVISPRTGRPYAQTGVSGWKSGRTRDVPAEPLFALAKSLNLSMDQFALGESDGAREERLQILEELVYQIRDLPMIAMALGEEEDARREEGSTR